MSKYTPETRAEYNIFNIYLYSNYVSFIVSVFSIQILIIQLEGTLARIKAIVLGSIEDWHSTYRFPGCPGTNGCSQTGNYRAAGWNLAMNSQGSLCRASSSFPDQSLWVPGLPSAGLHASLPPQWHQAVALSSAWPPTNVSTPLLSKILKITDDDRCTWKNIYCHTVNNKILEEKINKIIPFWNVNA